MKIFYATTHATCKIIFIQFGLYENYFTRIFFHENLLDEIKANYGIQLAYLGELSCAKHFIVCTGLSFNLRK